MPATTGPNGQITQQQYSSMFLPPRDDLNSPDMYIPVMALVTYILLSVLLAGFRGDFHPELLGSITTTAIAVILFEILCLKMAMYILTINNDSQLLDLVAYSGYKFVGIIITMVASEILTPGRGTGGWVGWTVFIYTFLANAFFLVSSSTSAVLIICLPADLTATLAEIRVVARLGRLVPRRGYADGGSWPTQPPHAVPLRVLIRDSVCFHVGAQSRGTLCVRSWRFFMIWLRMQYGHELAGIEGVGGHVD